MIGSNNNWNIIPIKNYELGFKMIKGVQSQPETHSPK